MNWSDVLASQATATFLLWLTTLKGAKKKTAKKVCLKVFTAIKSIYADDPDFA
jgi:hypothetical protein